MAYTDGHNMIKDILDRRYNERKKGERRTWALKTGEPLSVQIDKKFDRDADNDAWSEGHREGNTDFHTAVCQRGRVAWLAACNRDLRMQYARGKGCTPRSAAGIRALAQAQLMVSRRSNNFVDKIIAESGGGAA